MDLEAFTEMVAENVVNRIGEKLITAHIETCPNKARLWKWLATSLLAAGGLHWLATAFL